MFFVNLGLAEFLTLFGLGSALMVTLYLLSRARRRHQVSTLRFWTTAAESIKQQHRRRVDQPWSLALQLLCLALLLLAIAQPRIGSRETGARDHVLLLDTSAWTAAVPAGRPQQGNWMRDVQTQALRWVRNLPAQDRVMVVYADSTPVPATRFEEDRRLVEAAIRNAVPGAGSLPLDQSVDFAVNAQRLNARRVGEIVYAGTGRVSARSQTASTAWPANLRYLNAPRQPQNVGITRLNLRRTAAGAPAWEGILSVRNYTQRSQTVRFAGALGGSPIAGGTINLPSAAESTASFTFQSRAAGWFEVRLLVQDDLAVDNRVTLEVPEIKTLRVAVFSDAVATWRPLLSSDPRIEASYAPASAYDANAAADVLILDKVRASVAPARPAIWIQPSGPGAPLQTKRAAGELVIQRWPGDHSLSLGLRTKDFRLATGGTLAPQQGDVVIAESTAGPVIVARNTPVKLVSLGFDPLSSRLRFELATPLLFANIMHWMNPEVFRQWNIQALTIGSVQMPLPEGAESGGLRVVSDGKAPVPYTVEHKQVRLFAAEPATVRLITGSSEQVLSLALPHVAETTWEPPATVRRDLRGLSSGGLLPKETWMWLAALALAGLLADWFLFGRARTARFSTAQRPEPEPLRRAS